MNKNIVATIALIAVGALIFAGLGYAAITIWSNEVPHTPVDPAVVLTTTNDTPDIGETVTWTATLDVPSDGVVVTFYKDMVSMGTDTTVAGVATFDYTVLSITSFIARASAEIT